MRAFLATLVLCAIPAFAAITATPTTAKDAAVFNPNVAGRNLAHAPAVPLTNAQRLARGLTPNAPRPRRKRSALQPRQSSTPCQTVTGTIQVGAGQTGYVTRSANAFGEYALTSDPTEALLVTYPNCGTSGPVDLTTTNGLSTYTLFGAITGFANTGNVDELGPGSYNYAYLGGTSETAPGAPAANGPSAFSAASGSPQAIESAIWLVDASGALTPQWINPDGSPATTSLLYVESSAAFALTGDPSLFASNFGQADVVSFTFVPQ